jgi:hypothetical protein
MLNEVSRRVPEASLKDLVGRLNKIATNRLPQMWELAWLHALSSFVPVEHERSLPGGKPDLWFSVKEGDHTVQVISDVTTLSDSALHAANPFQPLLDAVHEQARKVGISGGGFQAEVGHLEPGQEGAKKVQLLIPTGPAFQQLVKRKIKPFVKEISKDQSVPQRLVVAEPGARFTIEYKGPSQYSGGSYRAFDGVVSLDGNVLYNRLNDKTKQLRGAPVGAIRMLIVCDGDCTLLRRDNPTEGFSARQIVQEFLKGSSTLDLVALVTVTEEQSSFFSAFDRNRKLRLTMIDAGPGRPKHLSPGVYHAIGELLTQAIESMPKPRTMPNNALRRNLDSKWSASMIGGSVQSGQRVRISARALLELLAGDISYERFAQAHRWDEGQFNIFLSRLQSGHIFKSAKIERLGEDEDDDWIEFEFTMPDPSVSQFVLPVNSSGSANAEGM